MLAAMHELSRPAFPPAGEYLRRVVVLARQSIPPALPALVLLYFYRFGMELYLAVSGAADTPGGVRAIPAATWIVFACTYLPLVILLQTPFLPLQDALLRGERRSLLEGVKHVLERVWPIGVTSFVQAAIVTLPAFAILFVAALVGMSVGGAGAPARAILVLFAMVPAAAWVPIAVFFLCFATPLLLLDGRGPIASIRESFTITRRNAGALIGRYVLAIVLLTFAMLFASLPSAMVAIAMEVAGAKTVAASIARAVWDSAVSAVAFPFTVAAQLVLYRAAVPWAGGATAEGATAGAPGGAPLATDGENVTATSPYRFE
jgi:membrane-anchored glycerophosphoryl diester phosphodiesterase (GDPDase)